MSHPVLDFSELLHQWMNAAGISSFRALSRCSGVSRRQVERLRQGEVHLLSVQHSLQLSQALKVSLSQLLQTFGSATFQINESIDLPEPQEAESKTSDSASLEKIQAEYTRLQEVLMEQRSQLLQSFQTETLHVLEPLLLQWPTAAYAAQQNPTAPAVRLLPLLRPLEQLLQTWQIEVIGAVGQTVDYDPTLHQWADAVLPERGASVRVTHVGYRQANKLLYRAKVRWPDASPH